MKLRTYISKSSNDSPLFGAWLCSVAVFLVDIQFESQRDNAPVKATGAFTSLDWIRLIIAALATVSPILVVFGLNASFRGKKTSKNGKIFCLLATALYVPLFIFCLRRFFNM